jgi:hypothetical protein
MNVVLLTKWGDPLLKDYDWSQDVSSIKAPALIATGDADSVRTSHTVECFGAPCRKPGKIYRQKL